EARWLIEQVKGSKLLKGYRGSRPVDTDALVNILITISELMAEGRIREIDLNPLALYPAGALVLDAKISLSQ
ncbi:MAG: acetate--CoA ligase family protein, partial [Nitrospirae bacterium]|nr:acetate--CoA ligase family protein [Nitrospirota bacterium]